MTWLSLYVMSDEDKDSAMIYDKTNMFTL